MSQVSGCRAPSFVVQVLVGLSNWGRMPFIGLAPLTICITPDCLTACIVQDVFESSLNKRRKLTSTVLQYYWPLYIDTDVNVAALKTLSTFSSATVSC